MGQLFGDGSKVHYIWLNLGSNYKYYQHVLSISGGLNYSLFTEIMNLATYKFNSYFFE